MLRWTMMMALGLAGMAQAANVFESPSGVDEFSGKPRVFVLSDIGNEPDDQMSFVRLLLYSNEFDIEGLVATTSTWMKDYTQPEHMWRRSKPMARCSPTCSNMPPVFPPRRRCVRWSPRDPKVTDARPSSRASSPPAPRRCSPPHNATIRGRCG
jgi:hypothetical protein